MKWLIRFILIYWLLFASLQSAPAQVTALTHVRLVDGTGTSAIDDTTILVEGRRIKAVGRSDMKIPPGSRVIDGKGKTAIPGLADMHVHLVGGWDGEHPDILGYQNYLNSLLFSGITTVLDTGNVSPLILQLRAAIAIGEVVGPQIYCVGPLVDGSDPMWPAISVAIGSNYQVPSLIARLKEQRVDLVKLYVGLSDPIVWAISAEAKKHNLRTIVDQGFRNGSMDLMDDGIAGFAHLPFYRMSDDAIEHAKAKNVFFISTLIVQEFVTRRRLKDLGFLEDPLIADVTPPSQIRGLREYAQKPLKPEQEDQAKSFLTEFPGAEENVKRLWDKGVLIAAGTDAPYPGDFQGEGLHHDLELLVESGLTPLQAISAATKNAAAIVNASQEWGTLEPGKLANLVLIDGKPDRNIRDPRRIALIIKQGEIIDRDKLKFSSAAKDFAIASETTTH